MKQEVNVKIRARKARVHDIVSGCVNCVSRFSGLAHSHYESYVFRLMVKQYAKGEGVCILFILYVYLYSVFFSISYSVTVASEGYHSKNVDFVCQGLYL